MALFFLIIGLEIKRGFLEGRLSTAARMGLPACAALGGMAVPAAIYVGLNWGEPSLLGGWAIPTATDIVLSIGILSFLGPRIPVGLKTFLTALAIFDDIGAVLIIGLFYGEPLSKIPLLLAVAGVAGLALLNIFKVARSSLYTAVGLYVWAAMLKSGVQAALAGVLIGFSVPLWTDWPGPSSPLRRAEETLRPWVVLVVVPLFAFFNSGVSLAGIDVESVLSTVSLGVAVGLYLGKQLGVLGAAWLAVRLGVAQLPQGATWTQMHGVGLLAGIGFTMSLFIASLAFTDPRFVISAKFAILAGSAASAVSGIVVLQASTKRAKRTAGMS